MQIKYKHKYPKTPNNGHTSMCISLCIGEPKMIVETDSMAVILLKCTVYLV